MVLHPMTEIAQLIDALHFAADKHRIQRRKDAEGSAYINHPIALVHLLSAEAGIADLVVLQAAALHDTLEDTKTSYDELVLAFGPEVADVVAEVTDDKTIADRAERKRLQLVNAPHKSRVAAMVKLADKTCNLRDILERPPAAWSADRKREYFDWARTVVDALPLASDRLLELFDAAHARRSELGRA